VRLPEAVGQAQARLDERQRGFMLPLTQQDPGSLVQQVGDQVVIPGAAGNGQRLLAVVPGDGVAVQVLEEVGRGGQRPGARQRRALGGWRGRTGAGEWYAPRASCAGSRPPPSA